MPPLGHFSLIRFGKDTVQAADQTAVFRRAQG
jgi:hypothetical protein